MDLARGLAELEGRGLGLSALLPTASLVTVAPGLLPLLTEFPTLLLIGSAGTRMWRSLEGRGWLSRRDPVDGHVMEALEAFEMLAFSTEADSAWRRIWPAQGGGGPVLPLSALGEAAGWSHRSPMGLGVHARYGPWFAYRGAYLLAAAHPPRHEAPSASPCASCAARPCVTACPAGAVGGEAGLDVAGCFGERLRPGTPCADRCDARLACPVGVEFRYCDAQLRHHHRAATGSYVRWRAAAGEAAVLPVLDEWRRR
jgi:hypothetical protein